MRGELGCAELALAYVQEHGGRVIRIGGPVKVRVGKSVSGYYSFHDVVETDGGKIIDPGLNRDTERYPDLDTYLRRTGNHSLVGKR